MELFVTGGGSLEGLRLELVAGDGTPYAGPNLTGSAAPGDVLLAGGPDLPGADFHFAGLQDGPGAARILGPGGVMDAVEWGGAGLGAGEPAAFGPLPTRAVLQRRTDGQDTDDNAADFCLQAEGGATPGAPNESCPVDEGALLGLRFVNWLDGSDLEQIVLREGDLMFVEFTMENLAPPATVATTGLTVDPVEVLDPSVVKAVDFGMVLPAGELGLGEKAYGIVDVVCLVEEGQTDIVKSAGITNDILGGFGALLALDFLTVVCDPGLQIPGPVTAPEECEACDDLPPEKDPEPFPNDLKEMRVTIEDHAQTGELGPQTLSVGASVTTAVEIRNVSEPFIPGLEGFGTPLRDVQRPDIDPGGLGLSVTGTFPRNTDLAIGEEVTEPSVTFTCLEPGDFRAIAKSREGPRLFTGPPFGIELATDDDELEITCEPVTSFFDVFIELPEEGAVFTHGGDPVPFQASARDPDGNPVTDPSAFTWQLESTGETLAEGPSFQFDRWDHLGPGQYTFVSVVNTASGRGSDEVTVRFNDPPTVEIVGPPPGTVFTDGEDLLIESTLEDAEDNSFPETAVGFTPGRCPGLIDPARVEIGGSGEPVTITHTVTVSGDCPPGDVGFTVSVTDSDGATGSDQSSFHLDHRPVVTLLSPTQDAFLSGAPIDFAASATDTEDGSSPGAGFGWTWTSSIDGVIGTQRTFTRDDLSEGTHTIEVVVTDSDGHTDAGTFTLEIVPPGQDFWAGQVDFNTSEGSIVVLSPDGSGPAQPLIGPVFDDEFFGGMTGNSFAFVRATAIGDPTGSDIWHADADGSNQVNLTDHPAFYRRGSFSPGGGTIVFESDRDDPQNIPGAVLNDVFVMNTDGTGVTKVITDAGFPSFTPGGRIVYSTDADGDDHFEIRIADADGSNASLLIDDDAASGHSFSEAVVSPDGTRIAVTRDDTETFEAVVLVGDFDGSSVTNLARLETGGDSFQPAWSPSGDRIAFASTRAGGAGGEIFVSDLSGTTVVNVSQTPDKIEFQPFWGAP